MAEATMAERDRDIAQRGLREAIAILEAIKGGTPHLDVFYEMGRAIGTMKMKLFESGGTL